MKEKISEGILLIIFYLIIIGGILLLNERFEDLNENDKQIKVVYNK